jgi:hypothetical protein
VDERLARHIAHLFIRDPLVIFKERIDSVDDHVSSEHFEVWEIVTAVHIQPRAFAIPMGTGLPLAILYGGRTSNRQTGRTSAGNHLHQTTKVTNWMIWLVDNKQLPFASSALHASLLFVADMGWRVELRTMEVQLTDSENAAFTVFAVLMSRVILFFELNLYIPTSKVCSRDFRRGLASITTVANGLFACAIG